MCEVAALRASLTEESGVGSRSCRNLEVRETGPRFISCAKFHFMREPTTDNVPYLGFARPFNCAISKVVEGSTVPARNVASWWAGGVLTCILRLLLIKC